MRKYTYPLLMTMLLIILMMLGMHVKTMLDAVPAWDGVYRCAPGTTYTVVECP